MYIKIPPLCGMVSPLPFTISTLQSRTIGNPQTSAAFPAAIVRVRPLRRRPV